MTRSLSRAKRTLTWRLLPRPYEHLVTPMPKNTGRRTFFRASSEARRRKNYGRTPCLVAHPRARPHALPHARVLPETHPRVSQTRRTPSNASRFVHPARARPPRTHDTKMAACSLVATPVALRAPAVNRARGRASLRCNAAAKGIAGDGRVKLCLSKEDFDAANAEAGDNLVRDRPPRPRVTHPQPRERAPGWISTVSAGYFAVFRDCRATRSERAFRGALFPFARERVSLS